MFSLSEILGNLLMCLPEMIFPYTHGFNPVLTASFMVGLMASVWAWSVVMAVLFLLLSPQGLV